MQIHSVQLFPLVSPGKIPGKDTKVSFSVIRNLNIMTCFKHRYLCECHDTRHRNALFSLFYFQNDCYNSNWTKLKLGAKVSIFALSYMSETQIFELSSVTLRHIIREKDYKANS